MDQQGLYGQYPSVQSAEKMRPARKKKHIRFYTLIACILLSGLLGGLVGGYLMLSFYNRRSDQALEAAFGGSDRQIGALSAASSFVPEIDADGDSTRTGLTKAQVIEFAAPCVVGIDTTYSTTGYSWFDASSSRQQTAGSGSGIIVSEDGYIVTCYHVVQGAKTIQVVLNDDTVHDASMVGFDERNDLAVIKIETSGLKSVTLGDSDMLTVGEDIIAIGNPLGELRGTATSGIVSALDRSVTVEDVTMQLIQTDAAMSPGNSGGGLFNASGTLIGIVNAKAGSDHSEGLGFAIPVNSVKGIISDLMDLGYVRGRAYLGVYTQNVTMQTSFTGWGSFAGGVNCVQVSQVTAGSAAEQAGIAIGDLILSVDETDISSNSVLSSVISAYNAGDTATITIQRSGSEMRLPVTFGEYFPGE